jgi:flagellar motor switch protein FliN/FliY
MSEDGKEEATEESMELEELSADVDSSPPAVADDDGGDRAAADLQAVFEVPVAVSAILGKTKMDVSDLLKLEKGSVVELDRKVGEAVDIYINNRLIARGEVVVVEEQLGITMTEIIKDEG